MCNALLPPPLLLLPLPSQVDRESATPERCAQVETQLFDLFASLGADDDQLNFMEGRLLYASGRTGTPNVCVLLE